MTQSVRQRNLFAAEDYRVVYDSFRQANFQAYDYDTIRGALVDYIQAQYPENYNDWTQSSEFVALIETLSFLAHSLAFRIDQAGRENFLSTAEKRSSVLRIAEFLGYTPARHQPARGKLKVTKIRTTQNVFDINGSSLKGNTVDFEDSYQNFLLIMNQILSSNNKFGRPTTTTRIGNVKHDVYSTNISSGRDVVFNVTGDINGIGRPFEIHGIRIDAATNTLRESDPNPGSSFDVAYLNDSQGLSSEQTGFFVGFKQGTLNFNDINASSAISDLVVNLNAANVNDTDIWVQEIDTNGAVQDTWTKVDSGFGANTVYNSIKQNNRKLYTVKSREDDNVDIQFGDGIFSEIPRGIIRIWYRTGVNQTYTLDPSDLGTVTFSFDYDGTDNNVYTATFTCELQAPVTNAASQESITSIKNNAGRVFSSQDRMITGSDYSTFPLTVSENVQKIKAVNRTYTGHSRFVKPQDPTGTYQSVDMIADDGYIYSEGINYRTSLDLPSNLSSEQIFERHIADVIEHPEVINLFYEKYAETDVGYFAEDSSFEWQQVSAGYRGSTGYLTIGGAVQKVGKSSSNELSMARPGSIVEFVADPYVEGGISDTVNIIDSGSGYTSVPVVTIRGTGTGATAVATLGTGTIANIAITNAGSGYQNPVVIEISGGGGTGAKAQASAVIADRTWARVVDLVDEGQGITDSNGNSTGLTSRGQGAIKLSKTIPNTARVTRIFPAYRTTFTTDERALIIDELSRLNSFGLRYDMELNEWNIVTASDISSATDSHPDNFSDVYAGDTSSTNADNSWIMRVDYSANNWKFITRRSRYIFGSDDKIRFFNQNGKRRYNIETNKPERDKITVLSVNTGANGSSQPLARDKQFYAYKYYTETDGYTDDRKVIVTLADVDNDNYPDNPLAFKDLVSTDTINLGTTREDGFTYTVRTDAGTAVSGRKELKFQWRRISTSKYRIDPSLANIIDIFVLNQNYDTLFRAWLADTRINSEKPEPDSEIDLETQFRNLSTKKAISDTIVYRPAEYKLLFGELAEVELRGRFKVIKISGTTLTDSEIKSRILTAINEFFSIDNWDFGETFYFTELSAYIHQQLPGIVSSVVLTPTQASSNFGDLFQITPESNELFIPDVTLGDIDIVDSINTL